MHIPLLEETEPLDDAVCKTLNAELVEFFFATDIPRLSVARDFCAVCPEAGPCLDGALNRQEPYGIWGGQLIWNGRIVLQKLPYGHPPKDGWPAEEIFIALPIKPEHAHLTRDDTKSGANEDVAA